MTALTLGIDLRGELARYGLTAPESIELLLAAGLDLSLTFRLSCLFGKDWHLPKAPAMLVENANPSLLRINVPRPMHILERLSADKTSLFLANVNIRDLSPQAACFDLWRDRNGQFDWTLVCHMSNKARFEKQYSRLLAWLEILGSSPVSGLTMTKTSARGIPMRRFEYKNLSVAACLLDGEADGAYLVLAGSENLIPERDDLRLVKGNRTLMAAWQIDLDGTATELLAKRLSRMMREHGLRNVEVDLLRSLVRQGDLGEARRDGDALVLSSQRSASLLVFAGLAGLFGDWLAQFDE